MRNINSFMNIKACKPVIVEAQHTNMKPENDQNGATLKNVFPHLHVVVHATEGVSRSTFAMLTHTDSQGEHNSSVAVTAGSFTSLDTRLLVCL